MLLIIEDDKDLCGLLEMYFKAKGYRVETAATGIAGLDSALSLKPDVVLLDMCLPDIGGLGILAELRSSGGDCRVIGFSANGDTALAKKALRAGASDYIFKPFELKALESTLERLMNQRRSKTSTQRTSLD
jgi:two-component system, NtrC family, response regulator AtoC